MSMRRDIRLPALVLTALGLVLVTGISGAFAQTAATNQTAATQAPAGLRETARLETFVKPDGTGYFAMSVIGPAAQAPAATHRDVVVLFDTSASQANEYRSMAIEAVDFFLTSLTADDRVQLYAVDLNMLPLTQTFVAPQGAEMKQALAALAERTPLGSTDMSAALKGVVAAFDGLAESADRSRSAVYIGDGMSIANLMAAGEMQQIVDTLCARHVSVHSYAIGPRTDAQLLGVLANHTGGVLLVDIQDLNGKQAGNLLADAVCGAVAWPTKVELPKEIVEYFPHKFPPIRFDRDTIIVGLGKPAGVADIKLQATLNGRAVELAWNTPVNAAADDHAYLPELIDLVRKDGGISLPTVGSAGLKEMRRIVFAKAYALLQLAKQAVAVGSYDQAQRLVGEALHMDPNNGEALALRKSVETALKEGKGTTQELRLVNFQPAAPGAPADAGAPAAVPPAAGAEAVPAPSAVPSNLLDEAAQRNKVVQQVVTTEVQNGVNAARALMGRDADGAIAMLKSLNERVRGEPALDGAIRTQLTEQIQTALKTAERQRQVAEERRIVTETARARQQEEDRLLRDLLVGEQKTEQLMARFENLMDERRYRDAVNVATIASQSAENTPATGSAIAFAQNVRHFDEAQTARALSYEGMVDSLMAIEFSRVPFPDDQPIVYPAKDVWELLTERRKKFERVSLGKSNEAETRILEELDKRTEVSYLDTQLGDVVNDLELRHKINVELDITALTADGKGSETLITKSLKDLTLRSALRLLLEEQALTYVIENEVLLITTKTAAETKTPTRVYPVADLVIPIPQGGLSGFGGLGGGIGGGGLGGGGGGGGGLGGGGGGLGGGGGMFAVEDDLRLSASPAPAAPAPVAAPAAQPAAAVPVADEVRPIQIQLEQGADVAAAWNAHFVANQESPAAVRETIRVLLKGGKPEHVVAVIMGAITNGQGQPWMYEALGLAMEMQGARVGEIERALMSAVDLSNNPEDLMRIAEYMVRSNLGQGALQRRALELYRQVARMQPLRPEPYVYGLQIARHLDDVEGLKWATLGVLGQAWTGDQQVIFNEAARTAQALVERLRTEKKTAEADSFQTALKEALVRDCVITISWTGEADVDLLVEEPTGATCSFRNPRTTGGGVLIEDAFDKATGRHKETYVCPSAFSGDYRMLAKRVWGKVTADMLSVEIVAHQGSAKERHIQKNIKLDGDQAAMAFDMQNGRRVDELEEVQVAAAARSQMEIGRTILAQQLSSLADPTLTGTFDPRMNPNFFMRGAVGYQPIIITLPEGVNMSATAVVSHDRRYVRVSAQPLFSTIPRVNTFNYVSGSSGSSGGGTGS